jgi:hypothetical protein
MAQAGVENRHLSGLISTVALGSVVGLSVPELMFSLNLSIIVDVIFCPDPTDLPGHFKTTMIMFFVVLCKVFPYTSSALIEIMPTKLIAATSLFVSERK